MKGASKQRGGREARQVDVGVEKAMNLGKACISKWRTMAWRVGQAGENLISAGAFTFLNAARRRHGEHTAMEQQAQQRSWGAALPRNATALDSGAAAASRPAAMRPPASQSRLPAAQRQSGVASAASGACSSWLLLHCRLAQKRSGVASAASGTCGVATGLSSVAWLARGPPERERFTASSSL